MARSGYSQGYIATASKLFEEINEKFPNRIDAIYYRGRILSEGDRTTEALSDFEKTISLSEKLVTKHPDDLLNISMDRFPIPA